MWALAKDQHYSMWAVLGFMDIMVEGDTDELKVGTEQFLSLKRRVSILEQYLSKVNLDPVTSLLIT